MLFREDAMKTALSTVATAVAAAISAGSAFAAPNAPDQSGMLAWSFLGFCAVIIVAQVLPAVMMIIGAAMGFKAETPTEAKTRN
jgi:hypothetical protein